MLANRLGVSLAEVDAMPLDDYLGWLAFFEWHKKEQEFAAEREALRG